MTTRDRASSGSSPSSSETLQTLVKASQAFHDAISARHHGRMPLEVQESYDRLGALLAAIAVPHQEKSAETGRGFVDFRKTRTWLVVRKKDVQPFEVTAFNRYDEAAVFFDRAQQQWSDCYFCSVVAGPEQPLSVPNEWFFTALPPQEDTTTKNEQTHARVVEGQPRRIAPAGSTAVGNELRDSDSQESNDGV